MHEAVQRATRLIPSGYTLVAEVETIVGATPPTDQQKNQLDDISVITGSGIEDYYWGDYSSEQFINGIGHASPEPHLYLNDIEPVIRQNVFY